MKAFFAQDERQHKQRRDKKTRCDEGEGANVIKRGFLRDKTKTPNQASERKGEIGLKASQFQENALTYRGAGGAGVGGGAGCTRGL